MHRQSPSAGVSHQTVRLGRGVHASPALGASVTELASMLAGERFSDRPASVCPVLAGFLRVYNDAIDDQRRQDLYRYAAAVVGTRSSTPVTRARSERAVQWGLACQASRRGPLAWFERHAALRPPDPSQPERAGAFAAVHAANGRRGQAHERALAFIDELIAVEDDPATRALPLHVTVADVVGRPALAQRRTVDPEAPGRDSGRRRRMRPRRWAVSAVLQHGVAHPICAVRIL